MKPPTENPGLPSHIFVETQAHDRREIVSHIEPRIRLGRTCSSVEPSTSRAWFAGHGRLEQPLHPLHLRSNLEENGAPKIVVTARAKPLLKPDPPLEEGMCGFAVPPRPPAVGSLITLKKSPDFQIDKAPPTPKGFFVWAPPESPFSVYYDRRVHYRIRQHALLQGNEEVGGVLIGRVYTNPDDGKPWIAITNSLEAKSAIENRASFTFTSATWVEFHQRVEEESSFSGKSFLGWYHTHPDLGVYLSSYDVFVHEYFFDKPWQVALVIDPESREASFFFQIDGKIYKPREPLAVFDIDELSIKGDERPKPPRKKKERKILIEGEGRGISSRKTLHTLAIFALTCLLLLFTIASKYRPFTPHILSALVSTAMLFWAIDHLGVKKKQLVMLLVGCILFLAVARLLGSVYEENVAYVVLVLLYLVCLGLIWLKFNSRPVSYSVSSDRPKKLAPKARFLQAATKRFGSRMGAELHVLKDLFSRTGIRFIMTGIAAIILILGLAQLLAAPAPGPNTSLGNPRTTALKNTVLPATGSITRMPLRKPTETLNVVVPRATTSHKGPASAVGGSAIPTSSPSVTDVPTPIPFNECSRFLTVSPGIRFFNQPGEMEGVLYRVPVAHLLLVATRQDRSISGEDSMWLVLDLQKKSGELWWGWVLVEELKKHAKCVSGD